MELFKYRSNFERDLISLASNQIYAPTYNQLNDPFEGLIDSIQDEKAIATFINGKSKNWHKAFKDVQEIINASGIYSLSKDCTNEILWSLYADGHKGFVIGYDTFQLISTINCSYNSPIIDRVPVQYCDNPKGLLQWRDSVYEGFNMSNGLGVKSKAWAHEKEIRLVFEQSGFFEYHFSSISRIIFGLRTSKENIKQTMLLLKGRNFKYQKIIMGENSFSLSVIDIEDLYKTEINYQQNWAQLEESLLTAEELRCKDLKLLEKMNLKVNEIRQMPKILKIVSVTIDQNKDPAELRITCICDYKQSPSITLLYQFSFDEFIRIPG